MTDSKSSEGNVAVSVHQLDVIRDLSRHGHRGLTLSPGLRPQDQSPGTGSHDQAREALAWSGTASMKQCARAFVDHAPAGSEGLDGLRQRIENLRQSLVKERGRASVTVLRIEESRLLIAHMGACKVFRVRGYHVEQLTEDLHGVGLKAVPCKEMAHLTLGRLDEYGEERLQRIKRIGVLEAVLRPHVGTPVSGSALQLGISPGLEPHYLEFRLATGDRFVICTPEAGLWFDSLPPGTTSTEEAPQILQKMQQRSDSFEQSRAKTWSAAVLDVSIAGEPAAPPVLRPALQAHLASHFARGLVDAHVINGCDWSAAVLTEGHGPPVQRAAAAKLAAWSLLGELQAAAELDCVQKHATKGIMRAHESLQSMVDDSWAGALRPAASLGILLSLPDRIGYLSIGKVRVYRLNAQNDRVEALAPARDPEGAVPEAGTAVQKALVAAGLDPLELLPALGWKSPLQEELHWLEPEPGDVLLLCSSVLWQTGEQHLRSSVEAPAENLEERHHASGFCLLQADNLKPWSEEFHGTHEPRYSRFYMPGLPLPHPERTNRSFAGGWFENVWPVIMEKDGEGIR